MVMTLHIDHILGLMILIQGPQCGKCRVVLLDNWYPRVNEETEGMTIR